jgi:hypothetical protein
VNHIVEPEIIMQSIVLQPERRRKPISALRTLRTFFIRKGLYPIDIYHVSKDRWVHVHMLTENGEQFSDQYNRSALKEMRKFNRSLSKINPQRNVEKLF